MSRRFLLSGYYGCGNLGDEAVLAGILRQLPPDAAVTVLSENPAATRELHGVTAVARKSPRAIFDAMRACDVFLSGGGSLFQDATSARSVVYYWSLVELAHLLGKPVAIWAQGLGPLSRPLSRLLTAQALSRARLITLRDETSIALARALGVTRPITLVADPALGLQPTVPAAPAVEPTLAVSVRPWRDWWTEAALDAFSGLLNAMHDRHRARIRLIVMKTPEDEQLARAVEQRMHNAPADLIQRQPGWSSGLGHADLVLGMRLHALILAAAGGAPSVGLAYDPKVSAFADTMRQPWVSNLAEVEPALLDAWQRRDELRTTVIGRRDELLDRSRATTALLHAL